MLKQEIAPTLTPPSGGSASRNVVSPSSLYVIAQIASMKINKEFPISFNIQLDYINEKASIDERLFIKKFNSYFGQF
ncbi:hypothetical protein EHQ49_16705, partial [Leptospira perdikensis]